MLFHHPITLLALSATFLSLASAAPTPEAPVAPAVSTPRRDLNFESLHGITSLRRDHSGRGGDPAGKYFHESTFHPHYDGRFAEKPLPDTERMSHLTALVQTYLSTMFDLGLDTWIMHGSLMGWWWNRKIMPWDSDIDVQISERSMQFLADYYNMTVHHFKIPGIEGGRKYLIEINPNWSNPSTDDVMNVIDARWIDTETGLFIDITTLRPNREAEANGIFGLMMCKDKHQYKEAQIFPLRESTFAGVPVKIPFAYSELLEQEYGPASLTNHNFENHHFDEKVMEWIPNDQPQPKPIHKSLSG